MNRFFHHVCPEVAEREIRSAQLPDGWSGIPPGSYAFVESYCTDPDCDCRRVLLFATRDNGEIAGVVSFAFDPDAPMRGPFLDPMNERAPYADAMLRFTATVLLADPEYVARLERHYQMVKEKFARPRKWWRKPKKPKKPRGW